MEEYVMVLEKQLAIAYDCTLEEVHSSENIYRILKVNKGARPIGNTDTLLKLTVYRGKLLVMAQQEMLDWCQSVFGQRRGTWFSEPLNLIMVHNKLQEYGHSLVDAHHHYIPAKHFQGAKQNFPVQWYEQEEINVFRGDERFTEALLFDENIPDMLAVCAMENDTILGMAGVTRDSDLMWQIGVNVTEEGSGKGIGTFVTTILKEEVLKRGIVPTYATAESHIKSQKVAFQSGFEPAFYEIFSR